MKIFVVTETEYEYNDEYYYTNGDGGEPVEAYTTKDKAETACVERCAELVRNTDLRYYGYSADNVMDVVKVAGVLGATVEQVNDCYDDETFRSLIKGKEVEVSKHLSITPFKVTEIELN